jgi:gamma-glutamyltranspeptidase/glutathione hydrolase
MLHAGGNALDAALATAISLVVVEPTGNGLGSDAFCILWDGNTLHGLNASGRSPASWSADRFAHLDRMPERGWDTVTVPGAVAAWRDLSKRFGRLPFQKLFEPAVEYAETGFFVTPVIAEQWRRGGELLKDQPGFAHTFLPDGRAPSAGELFRNPDMAQSLRLIAETNGEAFYRGELAERVTAFAKSHGAALTMSDLESHANDWCGTISQKIKGFDAHEIPPNGQGIAALMALGILNQFDIEDLSPESADAIHLQLEAMKLALADLYAYVGDLQWMKSVAVADLLSVDYLGSRAKMIDRGRAQDFGPGIPQESGTVCLATGDSDGQMVSFIQSNYAGFGSGIVVPKTGISLQNRGHGFELTPGHPNHVGPSKRPFHTIIPGFVMRDGKPVMSFGLMGGAMQAQGHVQMILRTLIWKQDPQTAADAPRWRVVNGLSVAIEPTAGKDVIQELERRGHRISIEAPDESFGFGGAQIIARRQGGYVGGSDPRKDGQVSGF